MPRNVLNASGMIRRAASRSVSFSGRILTVTAGPLFGRIPERADWNAWGHTTGRISALIEASHEPAAVYLN